MDNQSMADQFNISGNTTGPPKYTSFEATIDAIQLVLNFILLIIGVSGNICIIVSTLVKRNIRTVTHVMLAVVAGCDCLTCAVNIPLTIRSIIARVGWPPFGCPVAAYVAGVSVWYQPLISMVTKSATTYKKWFSHRNSAILQMAIWAIAGVHFLRPLAEGDQNLYQSEHDICIPDIEPSKLFQARTIRNVFFIGLPFVISALGYANVIVFLRRHAQRMNKSGSQRRENRLTYVLIQLFIIYVLTYIPRILNIVDVSTMHLRMWSNFMKFLYWTTSAIDPILYCWKIDVYRKCFTSVIRKICRNVRVTDTAQRNTLRKLPHTYAKKDVPNPAQHSPRNEIVEETTDNSISVIALPVASCSYRTNTQRKAWIGATEGLSIVKKTLL